VIFDVIDQRIRRNLASHPLARIPAEEAKAALLEYSAFSYRAIQFLIAAATRIYEYPALREEVLENIAEELGKHTRGKPHLAIMRDGYAKVGILTDLHHPNLDTKRFLESMADIFVFGSPDHVAGALYALEATAVFEFQGLRVLVEKYCNHNMVPISSDLEKYIIHHMVAEESHAAGMKKSLLPYITPEKEQSMILGAFEVIRLMEKWFLVPNHS
jgi:hypothetical protein